MPHNDRYRPLAYLGEGGMGRVYKAYDIQLKRIVALKLLKNVEHDSVERFLHEGRAQAQVEHPNVCNIYSVGQIENHTFIAMRFINGPTLRAAAPELSLEQNVRIFRDVAEGLTSCWNTPKKLVGTRSSRISVLRASWNTKV